MCGLQKKSGILTDLDANTATSTFKKRNLASGEGILVSKNEMANSRLRI